MTSGITPPYSADIRDGVIYARGVADNKDGLVTRLCAVDAWQKVHGKLPLNVKFCFEGEEETGSPHLASVAKAHPEMIQCDGYVGRAATAKRAARPRLPWA